ncbi:hypothetical protein [Caulobacter sp. BP25]|uniref:TRAFAC clade GTPase domain-containing protein n=1 Tax=Caulobacter sp. BP25 TaxID=2048900 RepID=UPI000C12C515|nr:hypothetical protein [Caulobacter sp. BP25]PHY21506.1 hypothetical protein CSW59_04655 [Caulobacter sp. BP25]
MTGQLLIAGMPNSGKSTFIAALRYLVTSRETQTALEQTRLSDNEAHFNLLEERWLAGERMKRTQNPSEAWVTLHVRDRESGAEADISIPDLKGERFEQPAAAGFCDHSLYDALVASDGLMVFTNADRSADDTMIGEMDDVVSSLEAGTGPAEPSTDDQASSPLVAQPTQQTEPPAPAASIAPARFDPYDMPEQVKVVELLQMMNRRPQSGRRRKLVVVISGWDAAEEASKLTPEAWLAKYRPMLSQFLEYNSDLWAPQIYGVSAQGGVLPRDRAKLVAIRKPAERIKIVGHGAQTHDLTAPIRWLMAPEAK